MPSIKIYDQVYFQPVTVSDKVKDYFGPTGQTVGSKSLIIKAAATHSGIITRNNGFYLPSEMRSGVNSWTAQYPKPILVHHDQDNDPVGRVIGAGYVDLSMGIQDNKRIKDFFQGKENPSLLDNYLKGNLPFSEIIDFTIKYFCDSSLMSDDPDYQGLGYIELTAQISDPEAIQKILDKRYLTGSVGASTDKAVCSVCKTDWASAETICEHRPGSVYDGKKCVLIAGKLTYNEWSLVNTPADRHSRVIEIGSGSIQDRVQLDVSHDTISYSKYIPEISIHDSQKGQNNLMTIENILSVLSGSEQFKSSSQDALQQLAAKILETIKDTVEGKTPEELNKLILDTANQLSVVKDEVKEFFGSEYEVLVGDDTWGRDYVEMIFSAYQELKDSDPIMAKTILDAKLSAETRKGMSGSSFCGPDRSFPVPDCSHVTAARRLIGRYKGPGDKEAILACVNRKAKKMGCDASKSDTKDKDLGEYTTDDFDRLSDVQWQNLSNAVESERDICRHAECQQSLDSIKNELIKRDATITELKKELQDRAVDTTIEIKTLQTDNTSMLDRLTSLQDSINRQNIQYLHLLKSLSGQQVTPEIIATELHDKTTEFVSNLIRETESNVDFKKINDILNTGLARNPKENIVDPTLQQQEVKPGKQIEDESIDSITLQRMTRQYQILAKRSIAMADEWFSKEKVNYLAAKKAKQN